jgi:hypothetical protein
VRSSRVSASSPLAASHASISGRSLKSRRMPERTMA